MYILSLLQDVEAITDNVVEPHMDTGHQSVVYSYQGIP